MKDLSCYHWHGHILVDAKHHPLLPGMDFDNIVPIERETFRRIWSDYYEASMPNGIDARHLGYHDAPYEGQSGEAEPNWANCFLAVGHSFILGYEFYGCSVLPITKDQEADRDRAYHRAMIGNYGLKLTPTQPMIGAYHCP